MTLTQLIAQLRGQKAEKLTARNALVENLTALRGQDVTEENKTAAETALRSKNALDEEIRALDLKIAEYEAEEARDRVADEAARTVGAGGAAAPAYDQAARVTGQPSVYNAENNRGHEARSFFADAFAFTFRSDPGARERLEMHGREVQANGFTERATTTGSFAGLVVPQYLVDQAALVARAGRPVANSVMSMPLPEQGMTFQIPRGTTGVSAAVQTAENTAVSNTDEVWANVSVPVVTIAGQQDVSRQSLERGTPGIDSLVYMDLAGAYAVALDAQVISGSGSGGQMLGIYNTAGVNQASAFGAAATVPTFYSKTGGQISAVETSRFLPPTVIAMHPRRWNWLLTQVDSSNRPLVVPNGNGPFNAVGVQDGGPKYGSVVGTLFGLPVITDANIQTAQGTGPEDVVYVYRAEDLLLWEDGDGMPRQLRFEQTTGGSLTTKLVAYGYAAFTAGRYPAAVGLVGGNAGTAGFGLIAPTF